MKKIVTIIASFFIVCNFSYSQQGLTLYNMDRVLQSSFINPSIEVQHDFHLGGLIVPVFGQLPPPMYINYANNSFHYNSLFHMGTGNKADSLVLNLPKFMNSLRNTTHIRYDTHFELLNLGIRLDKFFLSVALTEKIKFGVSLPYDLFEFVVNGNKPYMDQDIPHDFSSLNVNFTHYREFAVGFSTAAASKLNIGGRAKVLFGQANFTTEIKTLTLHTDPESYHMTFNADMAIRASLPVFFDYEIHEDSIQFDINQASLDDFNPLNYALNMKNVGLAFDLGASYKLNNKIDLFASFTDLGMISWNTNPQNFISKGNFLFRGIEIDVFNDEESADNFVDSLMNIFLFELQENSYLTFLPSSLYAGGMYKFHDKLHFGALYRAEFYRKTLLPSITLSVNSNLTNWFSAHASYTIANNYGGNVGLGLSMRLGFVSTYFVTDNLIGMIFPQKMRNLNWRMGCNLVFGRKKEIKSSASYR